MISAEMKEVQIEKTNLLQGMNIINQDLFRKVHTETSLRIKIDELKLSLNQERANNFELKYIRDLNDQLVHQTDLNIMEKLKKKIGYIL